MVNKFSSSTIEHLQHYVYVYSDPDTGKPFYIGKGKGNRVFDHLKLDDDEGKTNKIKALAKRGKQPRIEILSFGLTEHEALIVEAAAIDLIGIGQGKLLNKKRGYEAKYFGRITPEQVEARYSGECLEREDITDDVLFIRINQSYHEDASALQLYEMTRGYWVLNPENADRVKYVMPVYEGIILEVYEPATWLVSGSTHMETRTQEKLKGRYEFVGKVVKTRSVRDKYVNKSVAHLFSHSNNNPIKYEGPSFRNE